MCLNFFESQDLFGYAITIQAQKGSRLHKTCLGGFISLLVKLIIIGYLGYCIWIMVTYQNN